MAGTIVARGFARGGQGQIVAHGLGSGEAIVIEEAHLYLSSSGAYPSHPVTGAVSPAVSVAGAGGLTVAVAAGHAAVGYVKAGVRPARPVVAGARPGKWMVAGLRVSPTIAGSDS